MRCVYDRCRRVAVVGTTRCRMHPHPTEPPMPPAAGAALASELIGLGYTPGSLGRLLCPGSTKVAAWIAGRRILRGEVAPRLDTMMRLAQVLHVTVTINADGELRILPDAPI